MLWPISAKLNRHPLRRKITTMTQLQGSVLSAKLHELLEKLVREAKPLQLLQGLEQLPELVGAEQQRSESTLTK
jgi:hypothetical protein